MFGDADTQSLISADPKFDNPEDRMGFIRKVFSILGMQFFVTTLICLIPFFNIKAAIWMDRTIWLLIVAIVVLVLVQCAIICVKEVARTPPYNYAALLLFTMCMSYIVATILAIYVLRGQEHIVLTAVLITLGMVTGLIIYAFVTGDDITYLLGLVFILASIGLVVGIVSLFKWNPVLHNMIIAICVMLFGLYLILDIKLLMGGKTYKLFIDDYIIAAMILYTDIIMIFLYILKLLSDGR